MALKDHTAAGQAAGYLFQPERALLWLAKSSAGAKVGVETSDDVVVGLAGGGGAQEQDKHSTSASHTPFQDRSKDLWNTLAIWLTAIRQGELALEKTRRWRCSSRRLALRVGAHAKA